MHLTGLSQLTTTATMLLTLICLLKEDQLTAALRDVRVSVPHAVRRGERATLKCYYDMEGDSLYSVKWYKGRREFYRYTPKETPAMKVFQFAGVRVERSASNESQLVLETVNMATTGKYSCEVSADAPSFHTLISAGELEVVEVPGKDPIISGIRSRYRVGDTVKGNCTSRHSKPAANLTWTINGYETNPAHIRHHKVPKDARDMETSISAIHFVVTPQHFVYGKLKIRCTAHIHDVYWKSTEKSIEEERHKHSTTGNNINFVNTFSEDYFDLDDENVGDRSDTYMTHIKGDVSSLNANSAARSKTLLTRVARIIWLLYALQAILHLFMQQQHLKRTTQKTTNNSGNQNNSSSSSNCKSGNISNENKNSNNNVSNNNNGNNGQNKSKTNSSNNGSNCSNNCLNNGKNNSNNKNANKQHTASGQHLSVGNVLKNKTTIRSEVIEKFEINAQQQQKVLGQQHLLIIKKTNTSSSSSSSKHNSNINNWHNNKDKLCRVALELQLQRQLHQRQQQHQANLYNAMLAAATIVPANTNTTTTISTTACMPTFTPTSTPTLESASLTPTKGCIFKLTPRS